MLRCCCCCCCLGNEETAQLALDRIVDLYNESMCAAFNSGLESIVRLMLDHGVQIITELCA